MRTHRSVTVLAVLAVLVSGLTLSSGSAGGAPFELRSAQVASRPDSAAPNLPGASGLGQTLDMDDDGGAVVFTTSTSALAGAGTDTNAKQDVYWKQASTGDVELVSLGNAGMQPDQNSGSPSMSGDGRYVAFVTTANNLGVAGDLNGAADVYVRDRQTDTTTRASVGQPNLLGGGAQPSISDTGRYVAFTDGGKVYRRDRTLATTVEVSLSSGGASAAGACSMPSISDDGDRVAFSCVAGADNLVTGDTNGAADVFLRVVGDEATLRMSVTSAEAQLGAGGTVGVISGDGQVVGFLSASSAIAGGTALGTELYLRKIASSETVLGSRADGTTTAGGGTGSIVSGFDLTADGTAVVYAASGGGRQPFPTTAATDVYVTRLESDGCTVLLSGTVRQGGNGASRTPVIGASTYAMSFASKASDLGSTDTNGAVEDVFRQEGIHCPPRQRFPDVPYAHPFFSEIDWMVGQELTSGYGDGTFRPTNPVTRQALASFLWKLEGEPVPVGPSPSFADVPADHPFRTAIWWMVGAGLTSGYGDGTFRPTNAVTRQALASFLWKLESSPPAPLPAALFTDVPADHPFHESIYWLVQKYIADGYADGSFKPSAPVSRQAAAAFLRRYDQSSGPKK